MSVCLTATAPGRIFFRTEPGISKESKDIDLIFRKALQHSHRTASSLWRELLREKVLEIYAECSKEGWDGYDAKPISMESFLGTLQLLDQLPNSILTPEAVPEPTGEIALEWRVGNEILFSLTVSNGTLVYAGIFGGSSRQHGEEQFFDLLPKTILDLLARYFFKS